jgi:hypothetical protein
MTTGMAVKTTMNETREARRTKPIDGIFGYITKTGFNI